MACFDVGEPFGNDIQERSIYSNGNTNDGHHNPALCSIVGLAHSVLPGRLPLGVESSRSLPPCFSSCLLARRILYPIYEEGWVS